MSLAIDINEVTEVLLADGWHHVENFDIDAYEYLTDDNKLLLYGNQTGACFVDLNEGTHIHPIVYCPMSSILAIRTKNPNED